jgi:peptidoglycan LD-endopeptidase LytH
MRHYFFGTLLYVFGSIALATPAGAATHGSDREPSAAQLQREANQAAGRYSKGQDVLERLEGEISKLEHQVGDLRAKIVPLRAIVTRRVVAIYEGRRTLETVAELAELRGPIDSARGARIVALASAHELDGIEALAATTAELRNRQEALRARHQEQQQALEQIDVERRQLDLKLVALSRKQVALQSRLIAAPPRLPAVRASRSARAAKAAAPFPIVDPASIPVVTDFVCPIDGAVAFTDTWGAPRSGGRRHQGTDLMNAYGTPNVAVVSGTIERHNGGAGGIAIYLKGDDGNTYYYAHLSEVVGPDRRVAQGELVGKTGATGNARGGANHTHFEFHPGGGPAVDSYPLLQAHCGVQLGDG